MSTEIIRSSVLREPNVLRFANRVCEVHTLEPVNTLHKSHFELSRLHFAISESAVLVETCSNTQLDWEN